MREARSSKWAAALGGAAALFVLLGPVGGESPGIAGRALGGAGHVGLGAGLAWLVGRGLAPGRRGWPLGLGVATFCGVVEGLQSLVGRTPEWSDWLFGTGGAVLVCSTWGRGGLLRWGGVLALAAVPFAWMAGLHWGEVRAFPVLARPGSFWAARGWELNGVELDVEVGRGFAATPAPGAESIAYPGLFRAPAVRNWRGAQRLKTKIYWPEAAPATFAIRIDDRPGNPPYAERFQKEFAATQGWTAVEISAGELAHAAGGREMRLERIAQWGVFLVSEVPFDYFLLGPVVLDMQEERP